MKLSFLVFCLTCVPQESALVGSDHPGSGVVETFAAVVASVGDGVRRVRLGELGFTCAIQTGFKLAMLTKTGSRNGVQT